MTDLLELVFAGLALGGRYALVALGFVVIYRATGVLNFAQGAFVALGAYLAWQLGESGLPFVAAAAGAVVLCGLAGALVPPLLLTRMVGQPPFAVIMVTLGLLLVIDQLIPTLWGYGAHDLGDPWGIATVDAGGVTLAVRDLWTIALAAAVLAALFAFVTLARFGLAMRAVALDPEASLANGIPVGRVVAASWAIAGMVAAVAGITLAAGASGVNPTIGVIALAAFPAMVLGGLESPTGAVAGALVIGVVQTLTAGYQPEHASWLGDGFHVVMPYVVMIAILLVRPYGLLGAREVQRA